MKRLGLANNTRLFFQVFISLAGIVGVAQSKDFLVLDTISKTPIDLVQVFYLDLELGSISNKDGKLRLPLKAAKLIASHINYNEKAFAFDDFKDKDTLFLTPKRNTLNEVVIYSLDLKAKLAAIYNSNHLQAYAIKKVTHNCTYKETLKVNDSLTRLFQVQLDWFSKNSFFRRDVAIDKQNIIHLNTVDFSKIKTINKAVLDSSGGYVENSGFFTYLHLNFLLGRLVNTAKDYSVEAIEENDNSVNVYFNAIQTENGKETFKYKNSLVVFNKGYTSIKSLQLDMLYSEGFKQAFSRLQKKPYKIKMKRHFVNLSFNTLSTNKYAIGYFTSQIQATIKTKAYQDNVTATQSLFVNESKLGVKIKKGNVDFFKPFFKNIPNRLHTSDVKILLTKSEKSFLKD